MHVFISLPVGYFVPMMFLFLSNSMFKYLGLGGVDLANPTARSGFINLVNSFLSYKSSPLITKNLSFSIDLACQTENAVPKSLFFKSRYLIFLFPNLFPKRFFI